jgi:hypothetical protein
LAGGALIALLLFLLFQYTPSGAPHAPTAGGGGGCSITGTVTDCFTTAQNPLTTPWTATSGLCGGYDGVKSVGSGAIPDVTNGTGCAIYTSWAGGNDHIVRIKLNYSLGDSAGVTGPCARCDTSGNGYLYLIKEAKVYVLTGGGGGATPVTGCPGPTDGHIFSLQIAGTTLTCRDETAGTSATGTDSTWSAGKPGILVDQNENLHGTTVSQFGAS